MNVIKCKHYIKSRSWIRSQEWYERLLLEKGIDAYLCFNQVIVRTINVEGNNYEEKNIISQTINVKGHTMRKKHDIPTKYVERRKTKAIIQMIWNSIGRKRWNSRL